VTPNRESVPPHPIDGALRAEGNYWTADQYTFRLIRDGDVTEVPPDGSEDYQRADQPEESPARHVAAAQEAAADDDGKKKKPR
jgi:hypothetical protein